MNHKLASIIIPTYNRAEYLKQAIDSALSQTIACEVIVCDHGSTDHTPEVAASYGDKIIYIRKIKDWGVHFCWLDGIMNATCEWIHINYDDDWIAPEFMEECLKLTSDQVGFVFTQANIVNDKSGTSEISFKYFNFGTGVHPARKAEWVLLDTVISPACVLVRKKDALNGLIMGEVPLAKTTYKGVGPDILISLLTLLNYKNFGYIEKPLAYFRAHDGSITVNSLKKEDTQKKIDQAYNEARGYYTLLKVSKAFVFKNAFLSIYRLYIKIINKVFN